jgi:hypothetical protein
LENIGTGVIQFFGVIIAIFIIGMIGLRLRTGFLGNSEISANPLASAVIDKISTFPVLFDWMLAFAFFGIMIGSLAFFFFVEQEGFMLVASWFVLIVISVLTLILGYILQVFTGNSVFSEVLGMMTFTGVFISNAFLFASLYFFSSILAIHIPRT